MKKKMLKMSVEINATKERVWNVLLEDETYRKWTSAFHPGSYAETDWKQGSKALFKTPEGDGMISKITMHRPAEVISMEHTGILKNGKEVIDNEESKNWTGLTETYRIKQKGNRSHLTIEQEIGDKYADQFKTMWEKALKNVKELAETST